jgi:hypothetical protein
LANAVLCHHTRMAKAIHCVDSKEQGSLALCSVVCGGGAKGHNLARVMCGISVKRVIRTLCVVILVGCAVAAEQPDALVARNAYGKVPLSFELNQGQTDARVKFLARASGYTLFVTPDEAVFAGRDGSVERMKLIGASPKLRFEPLDPQPGISNYFIGNDPSQWQTNVPHYGRVALRGVYPGIDLIFYSKERRLEYDWVVAPGADPKQIRVKWEGLSHLTKNASGDLVLTGSLVEKRPVILQEGRRIEGGYVVRGRRVAFELAKYDTTKPLLIDPAFIYSTYLGGSAGDGGSGIAVDSAGDAYITGSTNSTDFPTSNPLQASNHAHSSAYFGNNAFVTKFNPTGTALIYSTYLGGSGGGAGGGGIAVDGAGNAYVTGSTASADFPTSNPLQASNHAHTSTSSGNNAFVTKINAAGSALVYSTYLGGSEDLSEGVESGTGIAVDGAGNAYVTGETGSSNFPTSSPLQANTSSALFTAFVTKINAAGSAFVYSTYLGGSKGDSGIGIAVDETGNAYVTGYTYSSDFPTHNALQPGNPTTPQGTIDVSTGFVAKINAAGSAFVYSTYLGGTGNDSANGIAVDGAGNAYVTGRTGSSDFPVVNPLQPSNHGSSNAFVTKFNPAGSALVYSTYLGGSGGDGGGGIAVDGVGNAYVAGTTYSADFPTSNSLQASNLAYGSANNTNAFVAKINPAGSALIFSTYVGGSGNSVPLEFGGGSDGASAIAVDGAGKAYVTGGTTSTDFPTSDPLQASLGGTNDAFVLSISPLPPPFAAGGEAFLVSGGSGSLNVTFPADLAWTATSSASWLTLTGSTSGSGTGTLTYLVGANLGADRSATITVGGFAFTIQQEGSFPLSFFAPSLSFIGSMPHLAAEENWTTTFTLVNKSTSSATARLSLFGDPDGTLTLPLTSPQSGVLLAPSLDRTLSANASLIIETAGPQTPPVQVGSAQLSATGPVDGFAIFHHVITQQETVVPMETRNASSYLLAFDNTGGVLGVAVANVSAQAGNVGVVIRDDSGKQIGTGSIPMSADGHTSFVLPTQYPVTANIRGTIEFDTPAGGQISVLGMRFTSPNNALTTIPALANVGTIGGSVAHLATGNGWQSTFVLVNTGTTAAQVNLNFFADVTGAPLLLPISYPQVGSALSNVSTVSQTLAPGATLLVLTNAPASDSTPITGSAQFNTNGNVSGFVIFRYNPNGQEAVVPFESRNANAYVLAFDNTAGTATGVAVNNVSSITANVPVTIRDDAGNSLGGGTLPLAPNGHFAFTLVTDRYPVAANIRGTIEFDTPPGGQIGVLAFRIPVAHTFTTLPALAK